MPSNFLFSCFLNWEYIFFPRKCHYKVSCSIHSAFWWVIKIGSSSICVFSFWRCCEFMAGFHLRLFCSYLITDVSFCLTSHCFFFLELRPFCNSFKRSGLAYGWIWVILHLTETIWYSGGLILRFLVLVQKKLCRIWLHLLFLIHSADLFHLPLNSL